MRDVRPIPGFPHYYAASDGTIWREWSDHWTQLRPTLSSCKRTAFAVHRYLTLKMPGRESGRQRTYRVHTLVLMAFKGSPQTEQVGRHLDGDRMNNAPSNLEWGTRKQNTQDMLRHGTHRTRYVPPAAHRRPACARFTDQEIEEIRRSEMKTRALARHLGVDNSLISRIRNHKTYRRPVTVAVSGGNNE